MKIVAFSINPIFPDVITGGASKHLYHITRLLGQEGHAVKILCAQSQPHSTGFEWAKNVHVLPILPFHLPFPQPYAISGADLGLIVERISYHLQTADRFYIHDGEFLISDVYAHIPTVTSFRDNIYPESVLGTFVGKADDVICISQFSYDVIRSTAGRFYPGLQERMHLVNNGIDLEVFKLVDYSALAARLKVNPQDDLILLHPHRPEPGKGLPETIKVVDRLVHQHGLQRVKVLIPEWIQSMVSGGEADFYQQMMTLMDELGVREHFVFIPWLAQEQMAALYSLGRATLCLGSFVETFGNVAYESLACGTPSIVAQVGVHRTLLPDHLIDKVDFGDTEGAVNRVLAILAGRRENHSDVLPYLQEHLNYHRQVSTYGEIITRSQKRQSLQFIPPQPAPDQLYSLAPWCFLTGERIYHDFRGEYFHDQALVALARESQSFTQQEASQQHISAQEWEAWLADTLIAPIE
ncbi:MAG: glycosyltransferase family 4 protein [Chloroflexi bacterium]|nr:glycosyltransferase family 4 protein [Chloroflexota bacterium]